MGDLNKEMLEVATDWIQDKGVSVWPSLDDGDTSNRKEAEALAVWFLEQMEDFDNFFYSRMRARYEETRRNLPA